MLREGDVNPLIFIFAAFVFIAAAAQSSAQEVETLAQPLRRDPPAYPEKCAPQRAGAIAPQQVKVIYDVTIDGKTENIGVLEAADDCFNEAAVKAVRDWVFEPRTVDGTPQPQKGLTTTLAFRLDDEPFKEAEPRPYHRDPPAYPMQCMNSAEKIELVTVRFDVSPDGVTENIAVIDSTNPCFERAAVKSIEKWRYNPELNDGNAVARKGVETTITFEAG